MLNPPFPAPKITIEDVDDLLMGYQWLKEHPRPQRPRRKSDLWDKAEYDAFDGPHPAVVLYDQLDPGYTKAEQEYPEALEKWEKESAPTRKRLDLGVVCVKGVLPYWSELPNASWYPVKTLETYHRAISCSQPELDRVIQDLERIQARLSRTQPPPVEKDSAGTRKKTEPRQGWTADRVNVAIHDYIEQNRPAYERLCNECTKGTGNEQAQKEWKKTFNPMPIARSIRQGLSNKRVQESSMYQTMLKPVLYGIHPLGRGQHNADDDIDKARERAGDRK